MAVAHVASATMVLTTGTTGGTITIPASVATGHDLYVMINSRGHTGIEPNVTCLDDDITGNLWTLIGVGATQNINLFWKKATAATASKTVTIALAIDSVTGGLSAFSGGLASGDPTTNLTIESNVSGNETHASITPSFANSMICLGVINFTSTNVVTLLACTNPGSLEPELWERLSTGGSDTYAIFAGVPQVGGPTATGNFTWSQTNSSGRSLAFAIRADPAAITGTGASTLAGVTSVGSGTVINPITGTGASTLDGVTSAGSGTVINPITGTGASTLAGVTSAGSGTFTAAITGTGASTLAGVTSAGTGVFTGTGPPPTPGRGCCGGRRRCCRRDRVSA